MAKYNRKLFKNNNSLAYILHALDVVYFSTMNVLISLEIILVEIHALRDPVTSETIDKQMKYGREIVFYFQRDPD